MIVGPAMRALEELPGTYPVSNLTPAHTGHPWGPEGYKTIAFEILADLDGAAPAAVVVPTGYGEMLYGIYKGFREALLLGHIDRLPRLVAVEPASRGPVYHALQKGRQTVTVDAGPTVQLGHCHHSQRLSSGCSNPEKRRALFADRR